MMVYTLPMDSFEAAQIELAVPCNRFDYYNLAFVVACNFGLAALSVRGLGQ
jgi:hypothetical protein